MKVSVQLIITELVDPLCCLENRIFCSSDDFTVGFKLLVIGEDGRLEVGEGREGEEREEGLLPPKTLNFVGVLTTYCSQVHCIHY